MNELSEKDRTEKEEPILILNLKYKYEDVVDSFSIIPQKYGKRYKSFKPAIFFMIFLFILVVLNFFIFDSYEERAIRNLYLWIFCICFFMLLYTMACIKTQKFILPMLEGKLFIKRIFKMYSVRSRSEMKRIMIPFRLSFYENHFTQMLPDLETINHTVVEEIEYLPVTEESKPIYYSNLKIIGQNKNLILLNRRTFIPRGQLSETELLALYSLLNKYNLVNN